MMKANMQIGAGLKQKLDKARMATAMQKALTTTMKEIDEASKKKAPKKTGNLRRSHSHDVTGSGTVLTGRVKNSANYWVYVNFGTSRIKNPAHFLENAVNSVQPEKRIKELFQKEYGGK